MFEKKPELTLLERFEKRAATKSEARRVLRLVEKVLPGDDIDSFALNPLCVFANRRGFGEKALLLVAMVQIDMLKEK